MSAEDAAYEGWQAQRDADRAFDKAESAEWYARQLERVFERNERDLATAIKALDVVASQPERFRWRSVRAARRALSRIRGTK